MRSSQRPFWSAILAATAAATFVMALTYTSSEASLRSSFATALTQSRIPATQVASASSAPVSGSEEYWLNAMKRDGNVPITKTVSVGDKISLSLGGEHRTLRVSRVAEYAPQTTAIDTSAGPSRFVLITAHDANDVAAPPVRFVMEIEQGAAPLLGGHAGRPS